MDFSFAPGPLEIATASLAPAARGPLAPDQAVARDE